MDAVKVKNLFFSYHDQQVLKGIDFEVKKGEKAFILGGNGEGKTTLLQQLNGLLEPAKGEISISGQKIRHGKNLEKIRKKVGYLFQNPENQIIAPVVAQDIGIGPCNLNLPEKEVEERVRKALKEVGITHLKDRKTHKLSVGERKKVAIAGVISLKPSILVLDEPASSLDPVSSEEIMELVNKLCRKGKTVVAATHRIDLAYDYADKVLLINDGKILKEGGPKKILREKGLLKKCSLKPPRFI